MLRHTVVLLLVWGVASAKAAEYYYAVQVGLAQPLPAAVETAREVAAKLECPLDEGSLQAPARTLSETSVSAIVHDDGTGSFVVTCYVGKSLEEVVAVYRKARKYFDVLYVVEPNEEGVEGSRFIRGRWVFKDLIVLGSFEDYSRALAYAREVSEKTGVPFFTRDMVFDPERGLIWPDDYEDDLLAGQYVGRRFDGCDEAGTNCISIERSDAYAGLSKGYYIVVGGFALDIEEDLATYRDAVPDVYLRTTIVYIGCMH